jgi:hypothetical protein
VKRLARSSHATVPLCSSFQRFAQTGISSPTIRTGGFGAFGDRGTMIFESTDESTVTIGILVQAFTSICFPG